MTDDHARLAVAALGVERLGDPARLAERFAAAGGRLVAVAEPEPRLQDALARELPDVPLRPLSEILADASIPAVVIGAATPHRGPVAVAAFEAGKHVAMEGPAAATVGEAAAMVEAWRRAGTVARIGRDFRRGSEIERVVLALRQGELGALRELRTRISARPPRADEDWRRLPDLGGGCLFDVAANHAQLVVRLLGGPPRVARGRTTSSDDLPEAGAEVRVEFDDGVKATLRVAYADEPSERIELVGEAGKMELERGLGDSGLGDDDLAAFLEDAAAGEMGEPWPETARQALVAMDAARLSAAWKEGVVEIRGEGQGVDPQ